MCILGGYSHCFIWLKLKDSRLSTDVMRTLRLHRSNVHSLRGMDMGIHSVKKVLKHTLASVTTTVA